MKKILLFLLLSLIFQETEAKKTVNKPQLYASLTSYISTGKDLPFWMKSNQNGIFAADNGSYQVARFGVLKEFYQENKDQWETIYGADLVTGYSSKIYFQPNQYWLGARYKWIVLKAGAQAETLKFNGLSSTNGNIDASNNARPIPNISLSTNGFTSFPFNNDWFSWKALYSEGILLDKNVVDKAHLHHKNFYVKAILKNDWTLSIGLEHYVFWGGTSLSGVKMPGWEEYIRYITGSKGGRNATTSDQINVAGNQLGSYSLELTKKYTNSTLTFTWNHPFEDHSGMELVNLPDGLWGIHWANTSRHPVITDITYEFMNTKDQSGSPEERAIRGGDNYFNHGFYSSGFTHFGQMMGTPLFVPTLSADGISYGFESTRMRMHHFGIRGVASKQISWKSMWTYSRNFGQYGNVYPVPKEELSFLAQISFRHRYLPIQFDGGLSGDIGARFENRYGGFIGIRWTLE